MQRDIISVCFFREKMRVMKVEVQRTNKRIIQLRYDSGVLKVLAFRFASLKKIKQVISENIEWINEQKNKTNGVPTKSEYRSAVTQTENTDEKIDSLAIRDFYLGKVTLIFGDAYSIRSSAAAKTYLEGNALFINEKYFSSKESRIRAVKSYLKKIAQLYVANEISQFGSSISLCPAKIEFKDISTDWIKCAAAAQKSLCIDYRIVQLPKDLRQYIIAHAFTHFFESTHDINFWNVLSNYLPGYQSCREILEKYDFLRDI